MEKDIKTSIIEEILEKFRDKIEFGTIKDPIDYATVKIILTTSSVAKIGTDSFLLDIGPLSREGFYRCVPAFEEGCPEKTLKEIMISMRERYSKDLEYEKRLLSEVETDYIGRSDSGLSREQIISRSKSGHQFSISRLEEKIKVLERYLK